MAHTLLTLATFFLVGLGVHLLCLKTPLPRVTLLILAGIVMGPSVLNVFAEARENWFPMVSDIALTMLGFLIGGSMTTQLFREQGKQILVLSLGIAAGTFAVVLFGILALGESLLLARQQTLPQRLMLCLRKAASTPASGAGCWVSLPSTTPGG